MITNIHLKGGRCSHFFYCSLNDVHNSNGHRTFPTHAIYSKQCLDWSSIRSHTRDWQQKKIMFLRRKLFLALRRRKSLIKSLKESQVEIVYKQSVSFLNSIKSLPPDPRAKLIVRFPTLFFTFFTPYLPFPCSFGFLSFQILLIFILDSFYNNCISKFKGQG